MSATPKQRDFIESLFIQKGVDQVTRDKTRIIMNLASANSREHISPIIDGLMQMPDAPKPEVPALTSATPDPGYPGKGLMNSKLRDADIHVAKYAIPTEELPAHIAHRYAGDNSHLHVEVEEFKSTRYMRILKGAPGSFSRIKFESVADQQLLITVLSNPADQLRYTQIFGDTYTCCGVCAAELTDDTSKLLKLGPVCRKRFGL